MNLISIWLLLSNDGKNLNARRHSLTVITRLNSDGPWLVPNLVFRQNIGPGPFDAPNLRSILPRVA